MIDFFLFRFCIIDDDRRISSQEGEGGRVCLFSLFLFVFYCAQSLVFGCFGGSCSRVCVGFYTVGVHEGQQGWDGLMSLG